MIVVTGIPRSGTSLVMQTLKILGVPVAGRKFPPREKRSLNPKGFYELDTPTMLKGIKKPLYKGQAVKILCSGLDGTYQKLVSRVIVCLRKKDACLNSLSRSFMVNDISENAESAYLLCRQSLGKFLVKTKAPILYIGFEDVLKDPELWVHRIGRFVDYNSHLSEAIANIDRRLE